MLKLDPHNANRGTDRGRRAVADSLAECGAGRSILVDRDGTVIAGNKTLEAAQALGLPVRVVESSGDELVVVQRTDLELDGEDQRARRLAYLDNRAAQLGLDWDTDQILADLDAGVDLSGLWDDTELDELLKRVAGSDGLTDPDDVPDVPSEPVTKPGDLWLLGRHRLLCGDSTVVTDVDRLMDGVKADMVFTDPPYALFGNSTGVAGITDDKMTRPFFLEVFKQSRRSTKMFAHIYVCCDWHSAFSLQAMAKQAGLTEKNLCIWDKGDGGVGAMYQHCYEMVWFFANSPIASGTIGKKQSGERTVQGKPNIWRFGRASNDRLHNAQKPVEMIAFAVENSTDVGGLVLDLFTGSGSTLIACEQTGRTCYGMEVEPSWCDVIVRRWEEFTGRKAVLDGNESHTQSS